MLSKIKTFISTFFTHSNLREFAKTLNSFCIIEITIIAFFSWQAYDLLQWYKAIMTVDNFNGVAFWGAIGGIVAAIFGAVKYINDTHNNK